MIPFNDVTTVCVTIIICLGATLYTFLKYVKTTQKNKANELERQHILEKEKLAYERLIQKERTLAEFAWRYLHDYAKDEKMKNYNNHSKAVEASIVYISEVISTKTK